jgi:O-acetyl-ADP-ribose deacetylase (regulator of RNase III)
MNEHRRRTYRFGPSQLTIEFGDITTSRAQVVVSSDDYLLSMGGGVSAALLRAAGPAVAEEAAKKVPANIGDVVVTTAGRLPAQHIFHCVTIGPTPGDAKKVVADAAQRCMELLDALQLRSIAFPAIGSGVARFNYVDVAQTMGETICEHLLKSRRELEVCIYLYDRRGTMTDIDFVDFFEQFAMRLPRPSDPVPPRPGVRPSDRRPPATPLPAAETADDYLRLRRHHLTDLVRALEEQRRVLEEKLVTLIVSDGPEDSLAAIRSKLEKNAVVRLDFLRELDSLRGSDAQPSTPRPPPAVPRGPLRIFVSSTALDLHEHRAAVKDQVARRSMLFEGMEHFGADPDRLAPAQRIIAAVEESDVYVGIFALRYGSIDEVTGLSMTELEFRAAEKRGMPMLLYVLAKDALVRADGIEQDSIGQQKLRNLKDYVCQRYTVCHFRTAQELGAQVYADLGKPMKVLP